MTKTPDAYSDRHSHQAAALRTFDDAIRDQITIRPTPFLDYLESKKKQYLAEWRDQPFNFAAMHVCCGILVWGVWFAIFVLPPAF